MDRPASTVLSIVGLALFSACLNFDPFTCGNNTQCVLDGKGGVCQLTGFCSYPDMTCVTGFRYEDNAPDGLGGECVDPLLPTSSSTAPPNPTEDETDSEASTTDDPSNSNNPVTTDPTMGDTTGETGDTCGSEGQACCPGDSCDPGLACFAGECSCVSAIDAGDHHTCAILVDGSVQCWGANDVGQLGDFVGVSSLSPVNASAMLGAGMAATAISATRQTCAVREDASVLCWGDNAVGQAAPADLINLILPPTVATFVAGATFPATGGSHTCIARSDGILATCFGANESGQITTGVAPGPIDVAAVFTFAQIEMGQNHGCGRTATGQVYCWGNNALGQLAADPGTVPTSDMLREVVLGGAAADMAIGLNHGCARVGGQIFCWGANNMGQLGDGSGVTQVAPVMTMVPDASGGDLISGPEHSCVLLGTGELYCWGSNAGDQLLNVAVDTFSLLPVLPEIGDLVVEAVVGGVEHACILTDTHQVHCWGPNTQGEAGVGMAGYVFEPTPIDLMCP